MRLKVVVLELLCAPRPALQHLQRQVCRGLDTLKRKVRPFCQPVRLPRLQLGQLALLELCGLAVADTVAGRNALQLLQACVLWRLSDAADSGAGCTLSHFDPLLLHGFLEANCPNLW